MTRSLTGHVCVPVANVEDARETARALDEYAIDRVTVAHVVEKSGGAPDKLPLEEAEDRAQEAIEAFQETYPEADYEITYGTDVVEAIVETAGSIGASAIAFHPRGGSRVVQFLAGDKALRLVTDADRPVIALPEDPTDV
ncbi:universal stress protein [Halococcoides cellulosivorans]|uniref:Universal stress protein n=1 Tax=Halococcoides cellulosivorans TaxID=1679096 RepID=A0A2R4WZU3_9EURY|nr:universal stress protein [Halococcoides cellulosivorans]AWB27025.1 universal stress protein [Halococcoides cellulosivorans]